MKIMFRVAAVAALLVAAGSTQAYAQGPVKLGYINAQQILATAPGRDAAERQFESEVGSFRQQIQRMDDSLRTLGERFQREQAALTAAVRQQRTQALQATEEAFQQRAAQLNQQMQQRQAELVRPIMDQLNRVLDEIRRADGYAFIFDVSSAGQAIVAADTTLNLTDRVMARLTALGPPPPAGPAGPATTPPATTPQPAGVTRPRP
ncbi:MAG TPA: OmpH family outer membrane protein [Gemmatimonadaceae bacterium]|nr:OmpH family outer membrane protein [Gemmatimonadaceae bacterium]